MISEGAALALAIFEGLTALLSLTGSGIQMYSSFQESARLQESAEKAARKENDRVQAMTVAENNRMLRESEQLPVRQEANVRSAKFGPARPRNLNTNN